MPAARNLIGERYGKLVVIERVAKLAKGFLWRCRCDCGNVCDVPQYRLPCTASAIRHRRDLVTACDACRLTRECAVCGQAFHAPNGQTTCSETCRVERIRREQLAHYYKRAAQDPELNRTRHAMAKARAAADPVVAERRREVAQAAHRRRTEKIRNDPELHAAKLAWQRAHYAAHRDEIQARRHERLAHMTPAQHARWMEMVRRHGRAYRRQWRDELQSNPEAHQKYLDLQREYRRQRALRQLVGVGAELIKRSNDK
ncbi:hypothetical protein N8I74_11030 [Chitiniphilus purpureus]|uniref:Uncharacterized protein n=1 Tax=Chitiniphilus purpureus TaxID=2981137 RepID=A0ABY6DHN1_9NEIS|nr:hypothetical protein [Chitiniphilus sp. CD1]UXY13855.1 hypothetical protein N8I74_11030 [Chitiniphilus sp. CD1]